MPHAEIALDGWAEIPDYRYRAHRAIVKLESQVGPEVDVGLIHDGRHFGDAKPGADQQGAEAVVADVLEVSSSAQRRIGPELRGEDGKLFRILLELSIAK